jgi:hypothetical protein
MCSAKTAPEHTEPTSNAYAFRCADQLLHTRRRRGLNAIGRRGGEDDDVDLVGREPARSRHWRAAFAPRSDVLSSSAA